MDPWFPERSGCCADARLAARGVGETERAASGGAVSTCAPAPGRAAGAVGEPSAERGLETSADFAVGKTLTLDDAVECAAGGVHTHPPYLEAEPPPS